MAKKITKKINSQFNPKYVDGYPIFMYGGKMHYGGGGQMSYMQGIQPNVLGADTLQAMNTTQLDPMTLKNTGAGGFNPSSTGLQVAGTLGEGVQDISEAYRPDKVNWGSNIGGGAATGAATGAAIGSIVPVPGTLIGGAIGAVGGAVSGAVKSVVKKAELEEQEEQQMQQQKEMLKKQTLSNLPNQQQYIPTFKNGGNLDNTTNYEAGSNHQQNPMGGVSLGNKGLVEEGEVRFKDYIFSNRIPYKRK
jgi:phage tail tape-measure protein